MKMGERALLIGARGDTKLSRTWGFGQHIWIIGPKSVQCPSDLEFKIVLIHEGFSLILLALELLFEVNCIQLRLLSDSRARQNKSICRETPEQKHHGKGRRFHHWNQSGL